MSFITPFRFAPFPLRAILASLVFLMPLAATGEPVKGTVVIARTQPIALLIWDSSAAVGDLVIAQKTGDAALRELEAQAIEILAMRAPRLSAKRIALRAAYLATGVVGAAYQPSTFANATPLFVLRADRKQLLIESKSWKDALRRGTTPPGLSVQITGSFPQSH